MGFQIEIDISRKTHFWFSKIQISLCRLSKNATKLVIGAVAYLKTEPEVVQLCLEC